MRCEDETVARCGEMGDAMLSSQNESDRCACERKAESMSQRRLL